MQSIRLESILSNFKAISLQEMDEVKLMNRVDTKFAFNSEQFLEILPKLCSTYRILEVNGNRIPAYQSLYLDDIGFKFYLDHHAGRYDRYKVRFRNYIESNLTFLEIKHKTKGRTKKSRIVVNTISESLNERERDFLSKNTNITSELVPKLWNSFNRITLVNNTLKERLTFDFELVFKWEKDEIAFKNLVIAELKQETVNRQSAFFTLMKSRLIRPYRLSKYCIGAIELYGTDCIKYNRFKEKLIKLKQINNHDTLTISNA